MKQALFTFILFFTLIGGAFSQPVEDTIGNGTSTGYYYSLLYRYSASTTSNYSKNAILYTQAELAAKNILPGNTITAVAFEKTTAAVLTNGATAVLTIGVKDGGTANSYPTGTNIYTYTASGFTTVATINYNTTTNNFAASAGWVYFNFTTPFVYTGGDLELYGDWVLTPGSGNPTDGAFNWRYHSTNPDYNTLFTYSASSSPGSFYRYNNRGNIIIVHTTSAPTGCTGTPSATTVTGPAGAVCANATANLNATGFSSGTGISYKWQSRPAATGGFTDIPSATSTSLAATVTQSTDYRMVTMCSGSGMADTSNVVTVTVTPLPVAGSITEVHTGLSYTFTPVGMQNVNSDLWLYGDGNTGTSTTHAYATPGSYTVRHAVANACGNDTATLVITAALPPCAGTPDPVTISGPASVCENTQASLVISGQSSGNGISYQWQSSPVGTATFTDILSANGTTLSALMQQQPLDFRFITTCSNSGLSDTSNVVSVAVDSLPVAGTVGKTHVMGDYTFTATGTQHAATQTWYYGDGNSDGTGVHTYTSDGAYNVMFVASNPCGSDTAYLAINVTLGVDDIDGNSGQVLVYPNPASDKVIISSEEAAISAVDVINSVGVVVWKEQPAPAKLQQLPVDRLPAGMYILRIQTSRGVLNRQLNIVR